MPAVEAIPIMMLLTTYQGLEFGLWSWGVHRLARRRPGPVAGVGGAAGDGGDRAGGAADLPFLSGHLAGLGAARHPDRRPHRDRWACRSSWCMATGALYEAGRASSPARPAGGRPRRCANAVRHAGGRRGVVVGRRARLRRRAHPPGGCAPRRRAQVKVGFVQANVGIHEKWDPARARSLLRLHQQLSAELDARAAPTRSCGPSRLTRSRCRARSRTTCRRATRAACAAASTTPLLFGAVTAGGRAAHPPDRYPYNTALMLDARRTHHRQVRQGLPADLRRVHPLLRAASPGSRDVFPEASNFNRGDRAGVVPAARCGAATSGWVRSSATRTSCPASRAAWRRSSRTCSSTSPTTPGSAAPPSPISTWRSRSFAPSSTGSIWCAPSTRASRRTSTPRDGCARPVPRRSDSFPPPEPVGLLAEAALLDRGGLYGRIGNLFAYLCRREAWRC